MTESKLEQEFLKTKEEFQEKILQYTEAAYVALNQAKKLSEELGLPFRFDLNQINIYVPTSLKEKWKDYISEMKTQGFDHYELRDVFDLRWFDFENDDGGYWVNSSGSC